MNQNLFINWSQKVEKSFNFFMNDLFFLSKNFLDRSVTCDSTSLEIIHQKKSITIIGLIVQNIWIKIKLYSSIKATWRLSYTCFMVFWAFRQLGETGPIYPKQAVIHRKYYLVCKSTFSIEWGLQANLHPTILGN